MPAGDYIQSLFARIANRYDGANRVLSLGCDEFWRKAMVTHLKPLNPNYILDVATGSGDVAFSLLKGLPNVKSIVGIDFCEPMLKKACEKQKVRDPKEKISFQCMDLFNFEGIEIFDAITVAFGVRNFENRLLGFQKMYDLLKTGGSLIILEASQPDAWIRPVYTLYLKKIMPLIAGWISGERSAYDYLADSVDQFPTANQIKHELLSIGFSSIEIQRFMLGSVAIHFCVK